MCQQYRRPDCPYQQPTRLLYLDPDHTDIAQLVSVSAAKTYVYATLSHRWGRPEPPKLSDLSESEDGCISIKRLQKGMPIAGLPRTFRDAIRIVQACEFHYIWIDSLCIIQDVVRGVNADWAKEAAKMGDIYAGGIL